MTRIILVGVLLLAACVNVGCRSAYEVDSARERSSTYSFVRPSKYVIFEIVSARKWLELVSESQAKNENGNLCVSIGLRNRGTQGFWGWFFGVRSRDMTIYGTVDLFDAQGNHIRTIPAQPLVLPLGETKYFKWTATSSDVSYARVTFKE